MTTAQELALLMDDPHNGPLMGDIDGVRFPVRSGQVVDGQLELTGVGEIGRDNAPGWLLTLLEGLPGDAEVLLMAQPTYISVDPTNERLIIIRPLYENSDS